MKAFTEKGHTVIAIGSEPEELWKDKFLENNIIYREIKVNRNGLNPFGDLKTLLSIWRILKQERPDKIFAYQAKSIVYGSVAARITGIKEFYMLVAGLGSIFRGDGFKNKLLRNVMKGQYRLAIKFSELVFFQNKDDKNEFIKLNLVKDNKVAIINGSGVNLKQFYPVPQPSKISFLYIGRLIKDKGVMEYLEACKIIKARYPETRCLLVGPFDSNPSALKEEELREYLKNDIIEFYGEQGDVRPYLEQVSTFVLPSYHEGTPKTILEAMAMGRSIITTNVPGCRETVNNGINGVLVEKMDINGLVSAMESLINNPDLSISMGEESIEIVKKRYDVKLVNQSIIEKMKL